MDNNTIEIRDEEINVEEIMQKIRENIRRRQATGELPSDTVLEHLSTSKNCGGCELGEAIHRDLSYINSNWDIRNDSYFIGSHHPYIGKFLIKGRQLVYGEVCRYVDPMISRQTEFNTCAARIITQESQRYAELNEHQQQLEAAFFAFKQESDKKTTDKITSVKGELEATTKETINGFLTANKELTLKVESTLQDLFTRMDNDIHARAWLAHVLEDRYQKGLAQNNSPLLSSSKENFNYFLFEERFRGSRKEIAQRQLAFLPYFDKCSRVLDIGCGRGEFLEILRDHAIGGIGVDSDLDMVAYCRSRQLEVEQSDAMTFLETLEDKSLDGIFIDQVVEHLEPDYLIRLLALCHQKLKFGYYIVVETVNPLSFVSFANFYIDMTHKRPVHPETLQFLISASGFRECEKRFFSQVSDENRLKKIDWPANINEDVKKNSDVYNHNVEILNSVLFGAQDYAIIGKK
jgi:SAM-dependent methyltransferase